jgi:hypothetical protein
MSGLISKQCLEERLKGALEDNYTDEVQDLLDRFCGYIENEVRQELTEYGLQKGSDNPEGRMSNDVLDHDIYVVIQEGGASTELYPSSYDDESEAQAAIDNHAEETYNSFGPYVVPKGTGLEQGLLDVMAEAMADCAMQNYAVVSEGVLEDA